MPALINLTGKSFGKWLVLDRHGDRWRCRCECERIGYVKASNLTLGKSTSCGKCGYAASAMPTLIALMDKKGVTQAQVAREVGMNQSSLCTILKGKQRLTQSHVDRLAAYFGVPATELPPPGERKTPKPAPQHVFDGRFVEKDEVKGEREYFTLRRASLNTKKRKPFIPLPTLKNLVQDGKIETEPRLVPGTLYPIKTMSAERLRALQEEIVLKGTRASKRWQSARDLSNGCGHEDRIAVGLYLAHLASEGLVARRSVTRVGKSEKEKSSNRRGWTKTIVYDTQALNRHLKKRTLLDASRDFHGRHKASAETRQLVLNALNDHLEPTPAIHERIGKDRLSRNMLLAILHTEADAGTIERAQPNGRTQGRHLPYCWRKAAPPPVPSPAEKSQRANPIIRADNNADKPKKLPKNLNVVKLAQAIKSNKDPNASLNEIALTVAEGDTKKAGDWLRQLRRPEFKHLLD